HCLVARPPLERLREAAKGNVVGDRDAGEGSLCRSETASEGIAMVAVYYDPSYAAADFAFPTTRKARWIADSLIARPIPGIILAQPPPLTEENLLAAHAIEYIRAVRTGEPRSLAQSQELDWDPGLWPMVLASNGGAVAAALRALQDGIAGSLSSG